MQIVLLVLLNKTGVASFLFFFNLNFERKIIQKAASGKQPSIRPVSPVDFTSNNRFGITLKCVKGDAGVLMTRGGGGGEAKAAAIYILKVDSLLILMHRTDLLPTFLSRAASVSLCFPLLLSRPVSFYNPLLQLAL